MAYTQILKSRIVHHLLFWGLSFYILIRFFAYEDSITKTDWIYTFLFHLSLVAGVYVNLNVLIPKWLRTQQYFIYGTAIILTLFGTAFLNRFTFTYLSDWLFPGYYFISYYNLVDILKFVAIYLFITSLLTLSRGWFRFNEQEKQITRLEKEKINAELTALKSQIDPHFLLNHLNSLYSLSLDEDPRTPQVIMKLSDNLRYMLYECNDQVVSLSEELTYVHNYVALQQLRCGHPESIKLNVEGEVGTQKIAPLLFLPFLENGFTHGQPGKQAESFLRILFQILPDSLIFQMENSHGKTDPALVRKGGIGLENVGRRLSLLYPDKHDLSITNTRQKYSVHLQLDLS